MDSNKLIELDDDLKKFAHKIDLKYVKPEKVLKNELTLSTIFTELNEKEFYYKRTANYIDRSIINKKGENNG